MPYVVSTHQSIHAPRWAYRQRTHAGNIQFDDPLLAYFCAESMIKGMVEQGVDHRYLLDLYVKTYNDCLKGRPADMNVGLHLCRGNFKVLTFI